MAIRICFRFEGRNGLSAGCVGALHTDTRLVNNKRDMNATMAYDRQIIATSLHNLLAANGGVDDVAIGTPYHATWFGEHTIPQATAQQYLMEIYYNHPLLSYKAGAIKMPKGKLRAIKAETIGETKPVLRQLIGWERPGVYDRDQRWCWMYVDGNKDYSQSNSKGTRGVFTTYKIYNGIYHLKCKTSWANTIDQYYIVKDGKPQEISEQTAYRMAREMING
jgi:hypothetical protein